MGRFVGSLDVEKIIDSAREWRLLSPFTYITDSGIVLKVPSGYITDYASVPRLFWWLLPPDDTYTYAAVIHDYLYDLHHQGLIPHWDREDADRVLLEAMKTLGVSAWKRWVIYAGVRVGGWIRWGN